MPKTFEVGIATVANDYPATNSITIHAANVTVSICREKDGRVSVTVRSNFTSEQEILYLGGEGCSDTEESNNEEVL